MTIVEKCGFMFWNRKNQVFEGFYKFKKIIEKQTSQCMKSLKINRGDKFLSIIFLKYYKIHGILW